MGKVRIRLEGISKSYYAKTAVTQALRKINLTFQMGEFVAITGESGSGKSTLLNIIGGMDTFDDGEMYVDGQPTFQYDDEDWEEYRRNKIGYVFQDYSLIGHYTVLDNMMSGLLIMGESKEEAEKTSRHYLQLVGLEGYELHKATELSSGQKQRLSIARALAKNTGIIVADEPTGNLDSETGEQIIALLKELSKDRLVIMVTHNYEQAASYVTRKIRIHDGEVVVDVLVNGGEDVSASISDEAPESAEVVEEAKQEHKAAAVDMKASKRSGMQEFWWQTRIASYFAKKNAVTQPGRAALFTVFLTIIAIASFLLMGQLWVYEDDITTKMYSNKAFYQESDTRIVVKKSDGTALTEEDYEIIKKLAYVEIVDSCDYANDINFYIEEDVDYEYLYSFNRFDREPKVTLKFISNEKFMRSTDCITEEDLAYGRLPEARNEIVLYAEDDSLLNKTKQCFFMANNIWDSGEYYDGTMKIVGILKEETDQVYFSKELCQMLSMHIDSGLHRIYYAYSYKKMDYEQKPELMLVIADDLTGNQVRISKELEQVTGEVIFHFQEYDEDGELSDEYVEEMVDVQKSNNNHTRDFLEVSREFYDKYYTAEDKQYSVYISSYAKTDEVIKALEKRGYDAISTIRIGASDYETKLVYDRLKVMAICFAGLLALVLAEILILRSLMKIRVKDYFVLKFIGMKMQMIRKISYLEIGVYCVIALVITIALMWGLNLAGISIIAEMMWYYEWNGYLLFVAYNVILSVLTVAAFNKLLKGRLNA